MKMSLILWAVAAALVIAPGCKKKTPIAVVPPPQSAPTPAPPVIAEPPRPAKAPSPVVAETRPAPVLNVTPAIVPKKSIAERLAGEVVDAYFDFDKSFIRPDANLALTRNADALKRILVDFENTTIIIEGHCDERGSAEYNIGLGDRRGNGSKEFLAAIGVDAQRLIVVSYGKERPQCTESNEDCWQRNRRVHFVPGETQRLRTE
jgi:peptidoglycan-associated lipoprotein